MLYVIIGLVCSPAGCDWRQADYYGSFPTEQECVAKAADIKPKTIMYFDLKCRPATAGART